MSNTFTPSTELIDYYRRYHRGELNTPPNRLVQPEDFDFPASSDWRDFYEQRYAGDIDFPVSLTWARHYRSIGLMPPLPEDAPARAAVPRAKEASTRPWLKVSTVVAKAPRPKKKPGMKGVLR